MNGSNRISRRHFIFAAGTGSAAAAAVLVAGRKEGPTVQPLKESMPPAGNGYRVTEHVRNYYRTTKV
jgi:hypothetical protein